MTREHTIRCATLLLAAMVAVPAGAKPKTKKDATVDARSAYIQKVQQSVSSQAPERTLGSLWSAGAPFSEVATDFKARRLNDTVIIHVVEQTSAQTNGNTQQNRTVALSSAITGIGGRTPASLNPLLTGASSQQLKGNGQVEADSQLNTSLTGQVISVLPNGNLVVEAQRAYKINSQHDALIVRGVVRPGDIGSGNSILSTQLMNLEVELKGKGLVSDGTRGPNVLTRSLMWLLGF